MDWNNDGILDILSGCYWTTQPRGQDASHLQFLEGKGGNNFAKSATIKSSSGQPLLNVPHKDVPKNQRKYDWRNICTHQFAADVDGDGDLDLIVGNIRSAAILHENKGSAGAPSFEDHGKILFELPTSKTSPHLYDWDDDGDLDFLTGGSNGAIHLAFNEGDSKTPKWTTFQEIISKRQTQDYMSKLCVADWNNDELPDIIVGTRNGTVKVFLQKSADRNR